MQQNCPPLYLAQAQHPMLGNRPSALLRHDQKAPQVTCSVPQCHCHDLQTTILNSAKLEDRAQIMTCRGCIVDKIAAAAERAKLHLNRVHRAERAIHCWPAGWTGRYWRDRALEGPVSASSVRGQPVALLLQRMPGHLLLFPKATKLQADGQPGPTAHLDVKLRGAVVIRI